MRGMQHGEQQPWGAPGMLQAVSAEMWCVNTPLDTLKGQTDPAGVESCLGGGAGNASIGQFTDEGDPC